MFLYVFEFGTISINKKKRVVDTISMFDILVRRRKLSFSICILYTKQGGGCQGMGDNTFHISIHQNSLYSIPNLTFSSSCSCRGSCSCSCCFFVAVVLIVGIHVLHACLLVLRVDFPPSPPSPPPPALPQAAVPGAIEALKKKKTWFSEQPRQPMTAGKPVQVSNQTELLMLYLVPVFIYTCIAKNPFRWCCELGNNESRTINSSY